MVGGLNDCISMNILTDVGAVYLHREPVDFRKSINGLSIIVEQSMALSLFDSAFFL
jgi:hypothetical protein